jgi:hypothetical protein
MQFPAFTLPDELRLPRNQVRRFIREEIIPLEQRLDPDAPGIPDEDFDRLAARTTAAGLWVLGGGRAMPPDRVIFRIVPVRVRAWGLG